MCAFRAFYALVICLPHVEPFLSCNSEHLLPKRCVGDDYAPLLFESGHCEAAGEGASNFTYSVVDSQMGLLAVKIDVGTSLCLDAEEQKVILCNENVPHSVVKRRCLDSKRGAVSEFVVNFPYVFSGRYKIVASSPGRPSWRSAFVDVKTNYVFKPSNGSHSHIFRFVRVAEKVNKKLTIRVHLNESFFYKQKPDIVTTLSLSDTNETVSKFYTYKNCNLDVCKKIDASCAFEDSANFTCTYRNMEAKAYNFKLFFPNDPRCTFASVFCNFNCSCIWNTSLTFPGLGEIANEGEEAKSNGALWTILLVVALLAIMSAVYCKCRKTRASSGDENAYSQVQTKSERRESHSEILLLYARDCDAFDRIIEGLKALLTAVGKAKVHDIHAYDDKKTVNPHQWLERKLCDEDVKTVLFLNECASHVSKNQTNASPYRNPASSDLLFNYALNQLKNNCSGSNTYKNLFILELSRVLYDNSCFGFMNPLTRYMMPEGAPKLLEELFSLEDDVRMDEFKEACRDCVEYYEKHPDYVRDVLNVPNGKGS